MTKESRFFDELCVFNITVISGVRPLGRSVDQLCGRKNFGIMFVWSGEATFCDEDGAITVVKDGALLYIPKNKKYKMEYTAQSTTFVVINFDAACIGNEEVSLFEDITLLMKDDEHNRIASIMAELELCGGMKNAGAILRKKELLYRLLGCVYASPEILSAKVDMDPKIFDGVRLLEQTYLESLPITKFSEASFISVNMFRSLFFKQFGMSPVKYRNQLRIERAKELLSEGSFSVEEVAYASGFENVGYFCRYYRRLMGETPGETKKRKGKPKNSI